MPPHRGRELSITTFAEHVDDYLRLRRALGFKLEEHARLLPKFAAHLDAIGAAYITVDLALGWAVEPIVPAGSVVPAMRLLVVRGFARHMAGMDPRQWQGPPSELIRLRRHRRPPFIYSDEQVLALMERARTGIRQRLVGATYETLIGILAERSGWALDHADGERTNALAIKYLNRLSDLLFILCRIANPDGDVKWVPGGATRS